MKNKFCLFFILFSFSSFSSEVSQEEIEAHLKIGRFYAQPNFREATGEEIAEAPMSSRNLLMATGKQIDTGLHDWIKSFSAGTQIEVHNEKMFSISYEIRPPVGNGQIYVTYVNMTGNL